MVSFRRGYFVVSYSKEKNTFHFVKKSKLLDPGVVQYGIPQIIHFGDFGVYKILIMTKTGPTLSELRRATEAQRFELKTICKIAIQAVSFFSIDLQQKMIK